MVGAGSRKKVKRYNFGSSPSKCGYIRWKTPAREAVHVPAQGLSIHYLTFFDRLFFHLPRIVMPSSSSFPPTLIGEEPFFSVGSSKLHDYSRLLREVG